jgi:hypothetical protein
MKNQFQNHTGGSIKKKKQKILESKQGFCDFKKKVGTGTGNSLEK